MLPLTVLLAILINLGTLTKSNEILAVKAQKQQPVTGAEGMIGEAALALTAIEPGGVGKVQTQGEIWTATAATPVAAGDTVRVREIKGLLLTVDRL